MSSGGPAFSKQDFLKKIDKINETIEGLSIFINSVHGQLREVMTRYNIELALLITQVDEPEPLDSLFIEMKQMNNLLTNSVLYFSGVNQALFLELNSLCDEAVLTHEEQSALREYNGKDKFKGIEPSRLLACGLQMKCLELAISEKLEEIERFNVNGINSRLNDFGIGTISEHLEKRRVPTFKLNDSTDEFEGSDLYKERDRRIKPITYEFDSSSTGWNSGQFSSGQFSSGDFSFLMEDVQKLNL